ncbi:2Fe-2S iron-sulfur cluster binding domain-containing protein [Novosphingobium sp. fls2-241-R2A-195]|jgi:p-cymene monooxygenase electron transfer component|uniref:2Fe-2S iron-sulfur cluster binding domain-containing protein n=1 Tax=Novosphingobium sp. fls2-241-R2A-195 TaxID=3040296 RepID=UPI00254C78C7|nr:2Fe-2S iron-sulfur cluster binding domain-containing protein [Novosphingobium sp. fls2-241-R2A-195]
MFKKLFGKKPEPQVELVPSGATFSVGRNKTVLEQALENGLAYPHDCTVGTCGSCRSRLLSGKVDAITPFGYTLSREELQAGYILACQAIPESDLRIEVDLPDAEEAPVTVGGRIVSVQDLTHDIRKVTWQVDAPLRFKAGQYMNVRWPSGPGHRSYSFCHAPAPEGSRTVSAFVRRVPGGAFTEALFAGELADTEFAIEGAHGGFWLRPGEGPIVLVGGGSGLSPLMSLLEDAAARNVARDVVLLFGGRGERDLYCLEDIAAIAARWEGKFLFRPVLSEEQVEGVRHGLVTREIADAIAELGGSADLQAYMCGPPPMIDAAVAELTAQGVALDAIHYDKFTDASSAAGARA